MANASEVPVANSRVSADTGVPRKRSLVAGVGDTSSSVGWKPGDTPMSDDDRRAAEQHNAARERRKQVLGLQRESILSQRVSNPGRRAALEAALAQIETQIQALG
jgi:hypothetical protein